MLIMIMKTSPLINVEGKYWGFSSGKVPELMWSLANLNFHFCCCRPIISFKIASFRLHPVWGTNSDDPVVIITEVLPLPPSRTIGNVGVSTGTRQPSLAKFLSQIGAYLWLYNEDYGRRPLYIKDKCRWYVYCDSVATIYQLIVAHRWLLPLCRYYEGCFHNNKTTLSWFLDARWRLC